MPMFWIVALIQNNLKDSLLELQYKLFHVKWLFSDKSNLKMFSCRYETQKKTPFILLMCPRTEINWAVFLCDQQKICPDGQPTSSAHPARFSPDDKFSRHRVTVKKRFGLLLTQQPRPILWESGRERDKSWMDGDQTKKQRDEDGTVKN